MALTSPPVKSPTVPTATTAIYRPHSLTPASHSRRAIRTNSPDGYTNRGKRHDRQRRTPPETALLWQGDGTADARSGHHRWRGSALRPYALALWLQQKEFRGAEVNG